MSAPRTAEILILLCWGISSISQPKPRRCGRGSRIALSCSPRCCGRLAPLHLAWRPLRRRAPPFPVARRRKGRAHCGKAVTTKFNIRTNFNNNGHSGLPFFFRPPGATASQGCTFRWPGRRVGWGAPARAGWVRVHQCSPLIVSIIIFPPRHAALQAAAPLLAAPTPTAS